MSKIKDMKLRYKVGAGIATAAAIAAGGGAAFAYWTGTGGTGAGTASIGTNGTVSIDNVSFGATPLYPGTTVTVTFNLNNPTNTTLKVGQVSADTSKGTNGISAASITGNCLAADFSFVSSATSYTVPPNSDTVTGTGTLHLNDTVVNQDDCKNASPVLNLAVATLPANS